MNEWLQLLIAGLGSFGFSLVFNTHGKNLIGATVGGFVAWSIYLVILHLTDNAYLGTFLASAGVTIYGECMARVYKTPVTVFLVSGLIPLIPGSALYYAMSSAIMQDWTGFSQMGGRAVLFAISIAAGIICATAVFQILRKAVK